MALVSPQTAHRSRLALGILKRAALRCWGRDVMLYTGGVSFFALLALFPALTLLIGFYSLFFTPDEAAAQAQTLAHLMPASARARETSTYTQGRVFDAITKKPIEAMVQLFDLNTNALTQQVYSDIETGEYTAVLNEGRAYAMYAAAPGYLLKSLNFDYSNRQKFDPLTLDIYLDPAKSGRSAVLNNLFFDSNQAVLKPRSRTELDRLVEFLRQDPSLRVEVAGYTDNVGTPAANLSLSQRRAQAVSDYLTGHGVPTTRLRAKGYGETRPLAANDTEAHRAQNRRIELRIL